MSSQIPLPFKSCRLWARRQLLISGGGEEDVLGAEKRRYWKVAKRKPSISMLEIEIANTDLKKLEAKVKRKKEETSLMKNNLAETRAMVEEVESMLNELKGGVYATKNCMQIT